MESYESGSKKNCNAIEKQIKLDKVRQEVEKLSDKLGMPIDEGIKETIIMLRTIDFPTTSSCAGHTEENEYGPPYVEFATNPPNGWEIDDRLKAIWKEQNFKNKKRLQILLNLFYKGRLVSADTQLELDEIGQFGIFRLESKGINMKADELNIKSISDVFDKIKLYQEEIKYFTVFLKELFLNENIKFEG